MQRGASITVIMAGGACLAQTGRLAEEILPGKIGLSALDR